MGKFVLVRDGFADEADVVDTLVEAQSLLQERFDDDPSYFEQYTRSQYHIYPLGDEISFSFVPASITVHGADVNTDIPAPMPGESVTDYAARITKS